MADGDYQHQQNNEAIPNPDASCRLFWRPYKDTICYREVSFGPDDARQSDDEHYNNNPHEYWNTKRETEQARPTYRVKLHTPLKSALLLPSAR